MTETAKGIHTHPKFKLGAIVDDSARDKRTLRLTDFIGKAAQAPASWDFDQGKKAFPWRMWGNDQFGDCEIAGRSNYLLRLQRGQTHTTPHILDEDAIAEYELMTGCKQPGDENDTGMTTLDNCKKWFKGWSITKDWPRGGQGTRDYHISAYGEIDFANRDLLHNSIYLFTGVLWGIALPITAQAQTDNNQPWDVVDHSLTGDSEPGSWGGHCVYSKKYDPDSVDIITWAKELKMTNAFIDAYAMEAYAVIDSFDSWFSFAHVLDVKSLIQEMQQLGINVDQS
jgi:hypothetical protein